MTSFRFIMCLLKSCRPAAIGWLVIAIIVYSVDAVSGGWSWAHVGKESLERFQPAVADLDTSAAISVESFVVWIPTPCEHCFPDVMFRPAAHPVRGSILSKLSREFSFLAAATNGIAVSECVGDDHFLHAAITPAFPVGPIPSALFVESEDYQLAESPPGQIFEVARPSGKLRVSHDASLHYRFANWSEPDGRDERQPARFIIANPTDPWSVAWKNSHRWVDKP